MSDDPLDDDPPEKDDSASGIHSVAARVGDGIADLGQWALSKVNQTNEAINWGRVKRAIFALFLMLLPIPILYLSYQLTGLLNTIVYTILFVLSFGLIPMLIGLLGKETPGNVALGKFHFVLAQFAAGEGYLVQTKGSYEMCPGGGDGECYWLNGTWHDIESGKQNMTVLGWKPFGIIHHKSDETLNDVRVDPAAISDGGSSEVERAGIAEKPPNPSVTGLDGSWLVDLKRLYRTGLQRVGNIDLVATAEEQTMRDEVDMSFTDKNTMLISSVVGVILGVIVGFVYAYGFGFV